MNFFQRLGLEAPAMVQGRYGTDALNLVLVGAGLVCSLFGRNMVLYLCSLAFCRWRCCACFRATSRRGGGKTRGFWACFAVRADAKTHRRFRCPKCHQKVRVPRGKGKIQITCPKCGEKFIKKT